MELTDNYICELIDQLPYIIAEVVCIPFPEMRIYIANILFRYLFSELKKAFHRKPENYKDVTDILKACVDNVVTIGTQIVPFFRKEEFYEMMNFILIDIVNRCLNTYHTHMIT
ncbi:MAG: hypothetical protein IJ821_01515, partial [Lachnospiraceae bacterium]|nr:hypothetical protein [Lachnospiraceae bacterium]